MIELWNPWHGCKRYSEGCLNCYVFRIDGGISRDAERVVRNSSFDLPLRRQAGGYKIKSGERVYTCLSSDFFLDTADEWRAEAWAIIRARPDVDFIIITKRILRFTEGLPCDWGNGYPNVTVSVTCENQRRADERLPYFLSLPIAHREIICEPLLGEIDLSPYLGDGIERVTVGGESGDGARVCDFDWVLTVRDACAAAHVPFHFKQTGACFRKGGRVFHVPRREQQEQARRAGLDLN